MMRCRICGSTKNLKFTPAEIRGSKKSKRLPLPLKEIANAINGNICKFCDLRLENFHKEASPVEIDITDDERYTEMFYKTEYGHIGAATFRSLGSDGDAEIIEVLTSRETTPDITVGESNHHGGRPTLNSNTRIVDVINLDDDDDDDDDESVKKPNNQTRQENLLGCLSLVTSDSESSEINFEPCHKINISTEKTPPKNVTDSNTRGESETATEQTFPVCDVCGIRFLDTASLQVHIKDNHQLPCPMCVLHFKTDLELVYHIRQKHHQYNGDKLCQGAMCAQDSAMTIRLRFDQSFTFYECQLCGQIDSQFKVHKEHIIQNHPDESKSLRDPMMKTKFSCPACHHKIGIHRVDVCRHMLSKHPDKYKKFIEEVTDLSTLPIKSLKSQSNIKHSARVLAFIGKEDRFYECRLCKKIWGNIKCFLTHVNMHNIHEWTEYEKQKSGIKPSVRSKRKIEEHKFDQLGRKQTSLPKNKTDFESCRKSKQQTTKKLTPPKDALKSKKQDDLFKKPLKQIVTNVEQKIEEASNKGKKQKKLKRRSKNDALLVQGTTKVKVKAPIRHFPTQKYNCKHCQSTFKGFRKLNLHVMQMHSALEFQASSYCKRLFTNETALVHHTNCSYADSLKGKRKRKRSSHPNENDTFDENFNKEHCSKVPRRIESKAGLAKSQNQNNEIQKESTDAWLKELHQLSWERKRNVCYSNSEFRFFKDLSKSDEEKLSRTAHNVCRYCARLFAEPLELITHEKLHTDAANMPWIALGDLIQN